MFQHFLPQQRHTPFREVDGVQSSLQRVDVVSPQSFIKRLVDENQQTLHVDPVQRAVPAHTRTQRGNDHLCKWVFVCFLLTTETKTQEFILGLRLEFKVRVQMTHLQVLVIGYRWMGSPFLKSVPDPEEEQTRSMRIPVKLLLSG